MDVCDNGNYWVCVVFESSPLVFSQQRRYVTYQSNVWRSLERKTSRTIYIIISFLSVSAKPTVSVCVVGDIHACSECFRCLIFFLANYLISMMQRKRIRHMWSNKYSTVLLFKIIKNKLLITDWFYLLIRPWKVLNLLQEYISVK